MSLYTTGELAKKCNVSVRTIQYYDERGILVPTDLTEGGRRLFSEKDVATLETICFLRDLDISIKDIAEILESDESKKVIELLLDELNKNLQADIKKKTEQLEKIKNINSERLINKIKYIALIFLSILIILIPIIYVIIVFNKLIKLRNQVKESWSTIDILLKKRTDLIPNIVEVVKGYSKYEKKTITEIIKARSNVLNATSKEESIKNNEALSKSVDKILLLKEEYPELKADKNYMSLQNKLSDLEDEISNSRIKYNKDVLKYKNEIEKVPSNIIANIFKFKPELFFEIDKEEKENQKISFK